MPDGAYLFDSNILIRWVKPDDHDYPLLNSLIESLIRQGSTLCYTSQNLAEFWNACTRPLERNGYGLTTGEADSRAAAIENTLNFLPDNADVHWEWRRLIVAHQVAGLQVHDARLVAAMHVHGIKRILTFNERDFAPYVDVEAWHPQLLSSKIGSS
jgi:predicted nucleic acid-binding protein